MIKQHHTINGKFYGVFYELPSGRKVYLAHRTPSQVFRARNAWCLDEATLRRCESLGIDTVGIAVRHARKTLVFLTLREDFWDPVKSFRHFGDTIQRGLPIRHFRINPAADPTTIAKLAAIGR